ncbi:MAG: N-acetylmuramoyl-L-alanine amidase, partial [Candidatus Erginobacter occultus]|nr:N-acetylmuramoyl-L-alanine amidase [Candidatus Erginobacter occultus]
EAADGPALLITFPPVEMTATPEAAIRLAGRIEPGREARVNGEPVEVYPGGSFVALVPLAGGENTITVSVLGRRGETVYPLAIRRKAAGPGKAPRREDFPRPLAGRVADPVPVGNISFDAEKSRAWFSLASPVPARVDYLSPEELDVVFHNAVSAAETIDLGDWKGICLPVPSGDGTARFRLRGGLDCHRWSLEYLPGGCRLSWRGRPRRGEGPVCLDPGHGGEQRGAVSPSGVAEKDANLALARAVAAELEKAGVETILTRDGDQTLSLNERIEIARRRGAGLFLSLHYNAGGSGRDPRAGSGYTVFYYHPPGRELAGDIHRALKAAGREGSGVRRRSLAVIRPTDLVTALLETAFLSHPEDEAKILDPAVRRQTARAIAEGVTGYLNR